ncbi:hypothetical protein [Methanosphaera cuniculi]|uniref:Uncharacterized protein n=1 Tax=Methanosphaera cuniculi TaxID=1077256 RepID=A0A2A2HDF2_9EURY|nr:hypothetical protein [Methanosphaera cuniculi]PAV07531.1 hypothetical protein ASJ82_07595 [Methanosphaera cuniculi]PWL08153.1 hypothetical protein MSCUN_10840 [Methanosphaera cuniculi]
MDNETIIQVEEKLATILAQIYTHIPWSNIKVNNAHKFFLDRIRASSNTQTFKQYIDVLCIKCNIEMIKLNIEDINYLNENNPLTMKLLRTETLYMCNYALEIVQNNKKGE